MLENTELMIENEQQKTEAEKALEALDFIESLTPAGKEILYNLIGAADFFEKAGMLKKSA